MKEVKARARRHGQKSQGGSSGLDAQAGAAVPPILVITPGLGRPRAAFVFGFGVRVGVNPNPNPNPNPIHKPPPSLTSSSSPAT